MPQPKLASHRETVKLPVGFEDQISGDVLHEVEVRPVTGADELWIGMSPEYNRSPNDLVYKTLLLSRCITRLGERAMVSISDVQRLHVRDLRAVEYAVYRLSYGDDAIPDEEDSPGG